MQLFMGSFGSCRDFPEALTKAACTVHGSEWLNPSYGSFDDFGSGMLLLYVMSSGDGAPCGIEPCGIGTRLGCIHRPGAGPSAESACCTGRRLGHAHRTHLPPYTLHPHVPSSTPRPPTDPGLIPV